MNFRLKRVRAIEFLDILEAIRFNGPIVGSHPLGRQQWPLPRGELFRPSPSPSQNSLVGFSERLDLCHIQQFVTKLMTRALNEIDKMSGFMAIR